MGWCPDWMMNVRLCGVERQLDSGDCMNEQANPNIEAKDKRLIDRKPENKSKF